MKDVWEGNLRQVWMNFPEDMVEEIREHVKRGQYANRTEFVRDAVRRRLAEMKAKEKVLALDSAESGGMIVLDSERTARTKLVSALEEYLEATNPDQ